MLSETLTASPIEPADSEELLRAEGLARHFVRTTGTLHRKRRVVRAVDGVDLRVDKGKTLGLVGESGCGKTTTGRMLVHLERSTAGHILLEGMDCTNPTASELERYRRRVQMIFQDATSSLDPKMTVAAAISEPLDTRNEETRSERREHVFELIERVGLSREMGSRYPHQLSGGQRQRVGIARALALSPQVIVADEPTSALDVSVRAQVVNLMRDLQAELQLSFIFISHDLSTVRYISDDVAVMYLGQIVEYAPSEPLFRQPRHPYTRALLAAVPIPDPAIESKRELILLPGDLPSPANPPTGCRFNTRCSLATARCREEQPKLTELEPGWSVACHYAE